MTPVHNLPIGKIRERAIALRDSGSLYDLENPLLPLLEKAFVKSIDRFSEVAHRFRSAMRVLDVGSGHGMFLAILKDLGHEVYALDLFDELGRKDNVYDRWGIHFQSCNVEVEPLPFPDEFFDAVCCCQVLEHFTHPHLPAVLEMKRVLRVGGIIEVDVPNIASLNNRFRLLRGKNIAYNYREHYLYAKPHVSHGHECYPNRHNREFTRGELELLLTEAGFTDVRVSYFRSRTLRAGLSRVNNIGSALRDLVPSLRKLLIAFARKDGNTNRRIGTVPVI